MDAIDRKIVALLQEDASLSLAQIAHRVGLSQRDRKSTRLNSSHT